MISVCIIARNEEKNIGRCLAALSDKGAELVVVDTGSCDSTRETARKYTDSVYDFAWCDDFSAAKNYAVSMAANDLVLVVDSDEFLDSISEEDWKEMQKQAHKNPDAVGRIRRRNVFMRDGVQQENREWVNRIFDRRKFHYEGRIHEQIVGSGGEDYQTWLSPLIFLHTGYDLTPEEKERKTQRNILLLDRELAQAKTAIEELRRENKDCAEAARLEGKLPYLLYQLGKSYYMAGAYQRSCEYFAQGLSFDLDPRLEYVIDMVETYGYALINSGQEQEAVFFETIYGEFGGSADFQFLMGLIYMKNARFDEAIAEFEKALQHKDCRNAGVNSYAANYNIGVILECLGNTEQAGAYYRKCKDYAPAKKRLEQEKFS
ncbi:glycosyltransferase [Lachnospiraceae bacterium]|nr:glycosyltransferase [Lachnospiraceae bacterium]